MDITELWPDYRPTPLLELPTLARLVGVRRVFVKVEGERPLGSFKALGGMTAGLRALARQASVDSILPRLICASAGNHGLSVATAAARARTRASVYLPVDISAERAERLASAGADVIRIQGTFDDAVLAAEAAAARGEGLLIPDTSTDADSRVVADVMEGYGLIARELIAQFTEDVRDRPTHLFVQAGVGGLAAAMVEGLQHFLATPAEFNIVEPEAAPCVAKALDLFFPSPRWGEGKNTTVAEMLACGAASAPAIAILRQHPVRSILVNEEELRIAPTLLREMGGPLTTPSGAAGFAGLLHLNANASLRKQHHLDDNSVVLLIATERALA